MIEETGKNSVHQATEALITELLMKDVESLGQSGKHSKYKRS